MKKVSIAILLFPLILSSHVNAEWTYVTKSMPGDMLSAKYYLDYDRISMDNGYIYYWSLANFIKPISQAGGITMSSSVTHKKVDCDTPRRVMDLQFIAYEKHFGRGDNLGRFSPPKKWEYLKPDTVHEGITNHVCSL